ncbi:MAG TPA: HEAT repeat domain-containing protein [Planctomycetota bacterium]|nr:HEAT repeat domain-containing protein [Planctomycetota bacterium]
MAGLRRVLLPLLLLLSAVARADGGAVELMGQLRDPEPLKRYEAARGLRQLGTAARPALGALALALKDEAAWVRLEAGRALVAIGITDDEVEPLVERLGPADPDVTQQVAEALAGLGAPAVPPVLKLLEGKDERARRAALLVVGIMGRPAAPATPLLLDLLTSDDAATVKLAGEALRRCGPWAEDYVLEIVDRLRFSDEKVRWAAAGVLSRIGPAAKAAIPALKEMRAEENEALRSAAAEALARIDVGGVRGQLAPALLDPKLAAGEAPERFRVRFETTRGELVVEVERAWAPRGADRFWNLARIGFFDGAAFFRVIEQYAQFGLSGESRVNGAWSGATIKDDPPKESNVKGTICFAKTAAPDSRTTQVFINRTDNTGLDRQGFVPFGRVVEGMDVVGKLYDGYGDMSPFGKGPDPRAIQSLGNGYLKTEFPRLDFIEHAAVVEEK